MHRPPLRRTFTARLRPSCCFAAAFVFTFASPRGGLRAADDASLFRAIRENDVVAVRGLLAAGANVHARDASGDTPLVEAALAAGIEVLKLLLESGADPNAANAVGATALMRAATRPEHAPLLLDAGARPDERSGLGNSPLLLAARIHGSTPVLRRLLDAGADVNASNIYGATALMAAAASEDIDAVRFLLDRNADIHAKPPMNGGGFILGGGRTALMWAAFRGNEPLLRLLLDRGAPVDDFGIPGSALTQAAWTGHANVARILIDAGANVNFRDPVGNFTPLHWAASTESLDPSVSQLLLERGADPAAEGGDPIDGFLGVAQTPQMLALLRGNTPVVHALMRSTTSEGPSPGSAASGAPADEPAPDVDPQAIAAAIARAIPPLQRTAAVSRASFLKHTSKQNCISCHQQYLPMAAVGMARGLRLPIDSAAAQEQIALSLEHPTMPKDFEAQAVFHPAPAVEIGLHLLGLKLEAQPASELTDGFVHHLAVIQAPDGRWHENLPRPPLQGSDLSSTALGVYSLAAYPIPGRQAEMGDRIARAARWLRAQPVVSADDHAYQILGLAWAGNAGDTLASFAERLVAQQQPDGGWRQLPGLKTDAYATGLILYALVKAGFNLDHPSIRRAARFLLATQHQDGSWRVTRRAFPFQPPMESGYPHGADSWISAAGASWAVLGLGTLLDPATPPTPTPRPDPDPPVAATPAAASPGTPITAPHDFASDIRPVLERSCLACHSGDKPKAGFRMESRASLLAGGNRGEAALTPGHPESSPLLLCVTDKIEDLEMPPLGKRDRFPGLTAAEIASLHAWIADDAPWPEGVTLKAADR